MSTLAIIPARAGSKGLPAKNKRLICGYPLIYWTIVAAQGACSLDEIVVSTDDDEIAEIARGLGINVPFMRPAHLAQDDTPGKEPILHTLQLMENFDSVVVLQPTSPLRTSKDIDAIVELAAVRNAASAVSVCETKEPVEWIFTVGDDATLRPLVSGSRVYRRQDANMTHTLNGALYYFEIPWFLAGKRFIDERTVAYIMPPERSIDIDTAFDWSIAEFLLGKAVW